MEAIDQKRGVLYLAPPLLGPSKLPLGALLGLSWGPLGALLGLSWGPLGGLGGPLGAILEAIDQRMGGSLCGSPRRGPKMSLLEPSWAALGAVLGALGAVLGPSWAPLGALLGHLGAILRPQEPIGRETARMQKTSKNTRDLKDFGLLRASLEGSKGTWSRPGAVLRALGCMLIAILNHLGLSCAILEAILGSLRPSWSHLGPKRTL